MNGACTLLKRVLNEEVSGSTAHKTEPVLPLTVLYEAGAGKYILQNFTGGISHVDCAAGGG